MSRKVIKELMKKLELVPILLSKGYNSEEFIFWRESVANLLSALGGDYCEKFLAIFMYSGVVRTKRYPGDCPNREAFDTFFRKSLKDAESFIRAVIADYNRKSWFKKFCDGGITRELGRFFGGLLNGYFS